jgi:hypothetical protein
MTHSEAHDLMDLLLDKADQPYFTTAEKDKFLSMAIAEWFQDMADKYAVDSDVQREMARFVVSESVSYAANDKGTVLFHQSTEYWPHVSAHSSSSFTTACYRILDVSVQLEDNGEWYNVERNTDIPSGGEHTTENPFRKPVLKSDSTKSIYTYSVSGNKLRVLPGGDLNSSSQAVSVSMLTFPVLSNVAGGGFSTATNVFGTSDVQLGAVMPTRSGTAWVDTSSVVKKIGANPEHQHAIVNRAVRLMMLNTQNPAYEAFFGETQIQSNKG